MPTPNLSSDSLAHAFFDNHPNAVLVLDPAGEVVRGNCAAAWLAVDGRYPSFAQLTGLAWHAPAAEPQHRNPGWTRRLRARSLSGSSHHVDATLFPAGHSAAEAAHCFLVLRDVTASVQATRAAQEAESRSKASSDSAAVLLWMADEDLSRDWFNKSWLGFRGRSLGQELGGGWMQGVHAEDTERCAGIIANSLPQREAFTMDYRLQRHDGAFRWVMDTGMPRLGADGAFLGYVGSCLDITDRKLLEDQLAAHTRALRLASHRREDFLARLSHELRNPLAPIANAAAILRRLEGSDDRLVMVREIVERQVDHLRRLITDLVDVTRITQGKIVLQRESVDINDLIDSAVGEVAGETEQRGQFVRIARHPTRLRCHGDAQRLSQALAALLRNAAKFSPDGSSILVACRLDGDSAVIDVRDAGRGIAPELLPQVFGLFVQGDASGGHEQGGLGVGLTIARRVVELHGGSVDIASAGVNRGSQATLRLPLLAGTDAGAAAEAADTDLSSVSGRRVLIIEDNDDARDSLRVLIEMAGNEVMTAGNAADGLRIAASFAPDLVVCDIGLPDVDGYELVQSLRDSLAGHPTRIVALTGHGRVEDRDRALDSGFDAFYVKPLRQPGRPPDDGAVNGADT